MKDNGFKLTKERSRRYPAQTIMDVDYADDIALLPNTPAQAETLLYSLERQRLKKCYLLNTQHYKVRIKSKWNNPGIGVVPSPTPQCSSY